MKKVHELKTWTEYYDLVVERIKPFEVRLMDRPYEVGDYLFLRDWNFEEDKYTGRACMVEVTYILLDSVFVSKGYGVMGIKFLS